MSQAVEYYTDNNPKGEYVLVVAGKSDEAELKEKQEEFSYLTVKEHVDMLIEGGMTKKDAVKDAAKQRGAAKRDIYNEYEREDL